MKRILLFCCAGLLTVVPTGCQKADGLPVDRAKFSVPGSAFTGLTVTNQLDPELLRPSPAPFTLGPGDRLQIEVLGQPTTQATTFVGPDGKIYYNLLPGLDVWGLTLNETRALLEKELGKYFSQPEVEVALREVGSKYIWVLGRLNRPGIYPLPMPTTLLEALALAGGTSRSTSQQSSQDLADLRHSFVMRKGQILPVDFYRLLREGDTSQNVMLQPDDFVYVRSAVAQEVYVLGAVAGPRAVPYVEGMTLVGALAGTGGAVKYDFLSQPSSAMFKDADLSKVALVRGSLAQPTIAVIDVNGIIKGRENDILVEPGDIVYVPNSPYKFLKSYLNLIINSFVTTVAANEGIRAGGGSVNVGVSVPVGTSSSTP